MFITLLSLGVSGYSSLLKQRKDVYIYLKERLKEVATIHGERLLDTPNNPISIGTFCASFYSSTMFHLCTPFSRLIACNILYIFRNDD